MRLNFKRITKSAEVDVVCKVCSKKDNKYVVAEQGVSPLNVDSNGKPKTEFQVTLSVLEELEKKKALLRSEFICFDCKRSSK